MKKAAIDGIPWRLAPVCPENINDISTTTENTRREREHTYLMDSITSAMIESGVSNVPRMAFEIIDDDALVRNLS